MLRLLSSRLTYANTMSTIAVTLALSGVSYAAATLPSNSVGTSQIRTGAVTGAKVRAGSLLARDFARGQLRTGTRGPMGPAGPAGAAGQIGAKGVDGQNGAVAGYSASQDPGTSLNLPNQGAPVVVPGLSKTLPAGSYLASGTILAQDFIPNGQGAADVHCALTDTPSDGSAALSHTTRWLGSTTITQTGFGELPYGLAFTTNAASTLTVSCFDNNSVPSNTTATVQSGVLQVVQTSSNN